MLCHGGLQGLQAVHGRLAAYGFGIAQGDQLIAPHLGQCLHALALGLHPLGFGVDACAQQRVGLLHQRSGAAQGAFHLGVQLLAHLCGSLLQRLHQGALLFHGLGCGALPFGAERVGQVLQGLAPVREPLRVGVALCLLGIGGCGLQCGQQGL